MKILLMSDNHGRWPKVNELVEYYRPQVDLILHCGDSEFAPDDPVWEKVDAVVTGNNDYDPEYPDELIINTRQGRIFLTHGHFHNVYFNSKRMVKAAHDNHCQLAFHGHTHVAYAKIEDGVLLCNPGSLNYSRGSLPYRTYAILTFEPQTVKVEFYDDDKHRLDQLTQVFDRNLLEEAGHDTSQN